MDKAMARAYLVSYSLLLPSPITERYGPPGSGESRDFQEIGLEVIVFLLQALVVWKALVSR